jgi:hypothetical protein
LSRSTLSPPRVTLHTAPVGGSTLRRMPPSPLQRTLPQADASAAGRARVVIDGDATITATL